PSTGCTTRPRPGAFGVATMRRRWRWCAATMAGCRSSGGSPNPMRSGTSRSSAEMRVLHYFRLSRPDSFGGVEQFIHQLSVATREFGVSSHVLATADTPQAATQRLDGHVVHQAPVGFRIAGVEFSATAAMRFRELAAKVDLVHYHFPWPFADLTHLAFGRKVPSIVTYHSDIVRQPTLLKFYSPLMHQFLGRVDRIVATSPNYVRPSLVLQRHRERLEVTPIGLDPLSYPPPFPAQSADAPGPRARRPHGRRFTEPRAHQPGPAAPSRAGRRDPDRPGPDELATAIARPGRGARTRTRAPLLPPRRQAALLQGHPCPSRCGPPHRHPGGDRRRRPARGVVAGAGQLARPVQRTFPRRGQRGGQVRTADAVSRGGPALAPALRGLRHLAARRRDVRQANGLLRNWHRHHLHQHRRRNRLRRRAGRSAPAARSDAAAAR